MSGLLSRLHPGDRVFVSGLPVKTLRVVDTTAAALVGATEKLTP